MFKRMDQSSKEDWDHIYNEHLPHVLDMPNRIISMLKELEGLTLGFGTNQLDLGKNHQPPSEDQPLMA